MSEEKLYAVKNDYGEWADSHYTFGLGAWASPDKARREEDAKHHGGHVVTLVQEPEKVVLTKKQAEIVDDAHAAIWPATYISGLEDSSEQRLLIEAFVNGYTVAKEKKYNVKVPHTSLYYWKKLDGGLSINDLVANDKYDAMKFTEAEIEHYDLQDCEKEEVTDDEND